MTGWEWVELVGLVFVVGGLGLTLHGLTSMQRSLFPGFPLPPGQLTRLLQWWGRNTTVVGMGASVTASATASATAIVTKGRPADSATQQAWNEYWQSHIDALKQQLNTVREQHQKSVDRLVKRMDEQRDDTNRNINEVRERLNLGLAGPNGHGLRLAWYGLFLTLLGTLAGGIASLAG